MGWEVWAVAEGKEAVVSAVRECWAAVLEAAAALGEVAEEAEEDSAGAGLT